MISFIHVGNPGKKCPVDLAPSLSAILRKAERLDSITSNSDQSVPSGMFAARHPKTSFGFHDNEFIKRLSNVMGSVRYKMSGFNVLIWFRVISRVQSWVLSIDILFSRNHCS